MLTLAGRRSPLPNFFAISVLVASVFALTLARPVLAADAPPLTKPAASTEAESSPSAAETSAIDEAANKAAAAQKKLEARIQSLEDQLELMQALSEDEEEAKPFTLPTFLNAMNPRLTVFGDAVGRIDTRPLTGAEGRIDNQFTLRETEIDFRASSDPFVDGVVILSIEGAPDRSYHLTIEEAYAHVKMLNLPILHEPPLGLSFKVGRFRASFGRLNQTHTHDLAQTDRPLVHRRFLGEEGLAGTGLSAQGFLPISWLDKRATLRFTLEGFGGEVAASPHKTQFVGMLDWTRLFGASHQLELTAMGDWGDTFREALGPVDRTLSLAAFYQWRPAGKSLYHSFILSAGFLHADRARAHNQHGEGYYAFAQAQLTRELFLGFRFDQSQSPNSTKWTRSIYPYLSWYSSEFFRLRVGWEHLLPADNSRDSGTLLFQLDFIFGSHPPEPYWVSR